MTHPDALVIASILATEAGHPNRALDYIPRAEAWLQRVSCAWPRVLAPCEATQSDHTADVEFHRYNQEWTGDPQ